MVGYRCSCDFLSQKLCLTNVQTVIWFPPKVLETITWFYFNRFSCHFNVNLESKTKNAMELLVLVSNELTANHFILNKFTGYMISFHSAWHIHFRDSQVLLILSPSLVCDWEWQALRQGHSTKDPHWNSGFHLCHSNQRARSHQDGRPSGCFSGSRALVPNLGARI